MSTTSTAPQKNPLLEMVQPFVDLVVAPRAMIGLNFAYLLEGMCYFGILGYGMVYFTDVVGLSDTWAGPSLTVLTAGITLSQFLLGGVGDRIGFRRAMLMALTLFFLGRGLLAVAPTLFGGAMAEPAKTEAQFGLLHLVAVGALVCIALGFGLWQPSAYSAVRKFTTPAKASTGYAMLYAMMNLGAWLPSFFAPVRQSLGIDGAIGVFAGITVLSFVILSTVMNQAAVNAAIAQAGSSAPTQETSPSISPKAPFHLTDWLRNHPFRDLRFTFFVFALMPAQTLFAHGYLTMPHYVARAYQGTWIGEHFEFAVNANPLLIFVLAPMIAALTRNAKVLSMILVGTLVMAIPTFLLVLPPSPVLLFAYLIFMTVGEAIWQPRFLQYAAEIAPEGRTGAYMGVAQLPWFLTKLIVGLYAGYFVQRYCPAEGPKDTATLWLIHACVAMASFALLLLARPWLSRGMKEAK